MSRSSKSRNNKSNNKNTNIQYMNYLTVSNGCKVISKLAKPLSHLNPQNILTQNIRQVWLSHQLPATCIIDMRNMKQKPVYFNRIGFNCWHQYSSNPRLIEIEYSNQQNDVQNKKWIILTKIRLQLKDGWQHFKIPLLMMRNLMFLKITIVENHSYSSKVNGISKRNNVVDQDQDDSNENNQHNNGNKYHNNYHYNGEEQQSSQTSTYLNQISLGCVEEIIQSRVQMATVGNMNNNQVINSRQKTFSDFRKISGSQKEIKRLTQKVRELTGQNQIMRRTMQKQNGLILRLQKAIDVLVQSVSKLQKVQSIQQHKINTLQKQKLTTYNKNHINKQQQSFDEDSDNQLPQKQQLKHKFNRNSHQKQQQRSKRNKQSQSKHNSYDEKNKTQSSKHNSYQKNKGNKSTAKISKQNYSNKKKLVINANIDQSDNQMSEYDGVVNDSKLQEKMFKINNRSFKGQNKQNRLSRQKTYIPMLQKLQQLIMLRDSKKHRLRTNKKPSQYNKQNIVDDYSKNSDNDSENNYNDSDY